MKFSPVICKHCGKLFSRKHKLDAHVELSSCKYDMFPHKCEWCKTFVCKTLDELDVHFQKEHQTTPFRCTECNEAFEDEIDLTYHKKDHLRPHKCSFCGSSFKWKCRLRDHIHTVHTGEKPFLCDICGRGFFYKNHLKTHRLVHSGEKPFVCEKCQKSFKRKYHLDVHKKTHALSYDKRSKKLIDTRSSRYLCHICGFVALTKQSLDSHIDTHSAEYQAEYVYCPHCPKKFRKKSSQLSRHSLVHNVIKCYICLEEFQNESELQEHKREHHRSNKKKSINYLPDGRIKCSKCGLYLKNKDTFRKHIKVHDMKKHKCQQCDYRAVHSYQLKGHIKRNHLPPENKIKCLECDMYLKNETNFRIHIRLTHGKNHKCELCDAQFAQKRQLQSHMNNHTGEKPFACELCHSSFTSKDYLMRHKTVKHDFKCTDCPKAFISNEQFIEHSSKCCAIRDGVECKICHLKFKTDDAYSVHMLTHVTPFVCGTCGDKFRRKKDLTMHTIIHLSRNRVYINVDDFEGDENCPWFQ